MIALHARRSAARDRRLARAPPATAAAGGADRHRPVPRHRRPTPEAQRSLRLTPTALVRAAGRRSAHAPAAGRAPRRTWCCQSARRASLARASRRAACDALMVGHLREEKDPRTVLRRGARLADRLPASASTTSAPRSTPRSAPRPRALAARAPALPLARRAAARVRRAQAHPAARMCWCTPAAWKAAPTSSIEAVTARHAGARPVAHRRQPRACWAPTTPGIFALGDAAGAGGPAARARATSRLCCRGLRAQCARARAAVRARRASVPRSRRRRRAAARPAGESHA
ncbi:MAG: hypothetical protein MZW92_28985 [Comamonadaceae bacterium]|nr:hypothetical protein [Comamonadaceae bacterium]